MTNTVQEKLDEILEGLPPDTLDEIHDELHEVLCKSMLGLLQDSIAGPGISKQQIESAREFAEVMPDTEAAKELLEFLDSKDVQKALIRDAPE
jgi:hypothetical protein